ncbi:MAG: VWA domain-containing protein [Acidobacteria bacterium]|nr:VWA domain-containing protein [Acidobacteriota bacterium]
MNLVVPTGGRAGMLAALLLTLPSSGQEAGRISVDVDLVVLHATVTDNRGSFVPGLGKSDFRVLEDGRPQTIGFLDYGDQPVAVGLVVDNSGSMRRKRDDVVAAALVFARSSNPNDEVFVVNFNEKTSLGLPARQLFSASADDLTLALKGVPARGRTALYDAILAGFDGLARSKLEKKALIVVSDGADNASRAGLDDVLRRAGLSNVMVYTIGLFDEFGNDRNPGVLRKIARATGGEAFMPERTDAVVRICRRIAHDIRSQYTIGYSPVDRRLDGSYRSIVVTARGSRGGPLAVRARAGYLASPERVRPEGGAR